MAKVGRNHPCPCGSGKKFKKCCGDTPIAQEGVDSLHEESEVLFGDSSERLISLLDSFSVSSTRTSYRIAPMDEFNGTEQLTERNRIYWSELLYRAHFGSSAGLLRLREWIVGAKRAHSDGNVLMLAAALRGLIEASADTYEAFANVAPTLADCHSFVRPAITGTLDGMCPLLPDVENSLIHFTYARKLERDETAPRLHQAKTAKEYLAALIEDIPEVTDAYALLCEYSHPTATTILRFSQRSEDRTILVLEPDAGHEHLNELVQISTVIGPRMLVLAVVPCMTTLKLLNAFDFPAVQTPWADNPDLDFSPAWRKIESRLRDPASPQLTPDTERERILAEVELLYQPPGKRQRKPKSH